MPKEPKKNAVPEKTLIMERERKLNEKIMQSIETLLANNGGDIMKARDSSGGDFAMKFTVEETVPKALDQDSELKVSLSFETKQKFNFTEESTVPGPTQEQLPLGEE